MLLRNLVQNNDPFITQELLQLFVTTNRDREERGVADRRRSLKHLTEHKHPNRVEVSQETHYIIHPHSSMYNFTCNCYIRAQSDEVASQQLPCFLCPTHALHPHSSLHTFCHLAQESCQELVVAGTSFSQGVGEGAGVLQRSSLALEGRQQGSQQDRGKGHLRAHCCWGKGQGRGRDGESDKVA